MIFKDYFSRQSASYVKYRPHYPKAFYRFLNELATEHELLWDCATGNGQAAIGLEPYFDQVIATDASSRQIANAFTNNKIQYMLQLAEKPAFIAKSIDMVTVAQAVHWFDHDLFFQAVKTVLKPKGIIAIWGYGLCRVSKSVDGWLDMLYNEILHSFWPPERTYVDDKYETIPFPFQAVDIPHTFQMTEIWNFSEFLAYIRTWSGTQLYIKEKQQDPLVKLQQDLENAWGDPENKKTIKWPIHIRVGRA